MTAILKSKPFIAFAIIAALVGVYALLGFQVAPGIVRDQAAGFVRENYGRELQVGEVRVHPFKLQLEVRDLALPDTDAQTMLGFERLFVDFELSSLWERAFVFKDVTLEAPVARAVVRPDGSLNLGDLAPARGSRGRGRAAAERLDPVARGRARHGHVHRRCAHDAVRAHFRPGGLRAAGLPHDARGRRLSISRRAARPTKRSTGRAASRSSRRSPRRASSRSPDCGRPASRSSSATRCPSSSPTARSTSRAPTRSRSASSWNWACSYRRSSWRNSACARAARMRTGSGFRP